MDYKILLKKSNGYSSYSEEITKPSPSELEYGEMAINYYKGLETLFVKNSNGEIAEFISKDYAEKMIKEKFDELALDFMGELYDSYKPLTFEAVSAGTIVVSGGGTYDYRVNDGEWTTKQAVSSVSNGDTVLGAASDLVLQVVRGDKVCLRAKITDLSIYTFDMSSSTAKFKVYGNIASLVDKTNYPITYALSGYNFSQLFAGCTGITEADRLIIPFTATTQNMCAGMFSGCTSLTTVPELPATTLGDVCYQSMFADCTSLVSAQTILPATTASSVCYQGMFSGCTSLEYAPEIALQTLGSACCQAMFKNCTSLETAPALSAATLVNGCYANMYQGCTALTYIECLATDISVTSATSNWVEGVGRTGEFIMAEGMENVWPKNSVNGIPAGWGETDYNALPLTFEVTEGSGKIVFNPYVYQTDAHLYYKVNDGEWTSHVDGTLPINVSVGDIIQFKGYAAIGEGTNLEAFVRYDDYDPDYSTSSSVRFNVYGNIASILEEDHYEDITNYTMVGYYSYSYESFFSGCTALVSAENLIIPFSGTSDFSYLNFKYMFKDCTNLVYGPKVLPSMNLYDQCYSSMFQACTSLVSAPELPATTLVYMCYEFMFDGCSSLSYVKCLAESMYDEYDVACTPYWLAGVASEGTFVKNPLLTTWPDGTGGCDGIPVGWTIVNYAGE